MKKRIWQIVSGALLFVCALVLDAFFGAEMGALRVLLYLPAYMAVGYNVLLACVQSLWRRHFLDENFLMSLASAAALCIGEYSEAIAVMLFYRVGEAFEHFAVLRSRRYLSSLLSMRPDTVRAVTENGYEEVDAEDVALGTRIFVGAGERVPLDCRLLSDFGTVDTSALTGEALPRHLARGDEVLSGAVCAEGSLLLEVIRPLETSTVTRILDAVENALERRSKTESFISRFARVYTPIVCASALLLFLLPTLMGLPMQVWLYRALNFLVVSCPCALVISVPLSFFGGIGGSAMRGVLIKGGAEIEALARVDTAVFDKTGTLTEGQLYLTDTLIEEGYDKEALLALAAHAEASSSHPYARALVSAYGKVLDSSLVSEITEHAGEGVSATVMGKSVLIGNRRLFARYGVALPQREAEGAHLLMAVCGVYAAAYVFEDRVRGEAKDALSALRSLGVSRTVLLSGDAEERARELADALGIDACHGALLPETKLALLEEEMQAGRRVLYVGDGINDAPVLARADVGVAMGGVGSDAAIELAGAVIVSDKLERLPETILRARRTVRIARENVLFALSVKLAVLVLSALGVTGLWLAVFADVGVAFLCILNSLRTLTK